MKYPEKPFKIRSSVEKLILSPTLAINEQVMGAREQGHQIIHMGFGQSPFPVHPIIQEALRANVDKNMYLPTAGLQELRSLARNYFSEKFGFDANEYKAIIGPGSKELVFDVQLAVDGDLLLPVPSWVSYAPQASLTNDHVIKIPTSIADNYHITAESLERAILDAKLKGRNPKKLIINYPNNPSGLTIYEDRLEQIAHVCKKNNVLVISDEIYGLVNYKYNHVSIARYYPEGTIVTSGLSKHISLGGYRLGVALVPLGLPKVFDAMISVASETWSTVSAPIQFAALKAFEKDQTLEEYIQTCTRIYSFISEYVRQNIMVLGIHYPELHGGFYLYPNFEKYRENLKNREVYSSEQLARDLIDRFQIATLPGTAFGDDPENLTLRLATCDFDGQAALNYYYDHPDCTAESFVPACCPNIKLGCRRLTEYFETLK